MFPTLVTLGLYVETTPGQTQAEIAALVKERLSEILEEEDNAEFATRLTIEVSEMAADLSPGKFIQLVYHQESLLLSLDTSQVLDQDADVTRLHDLLTGAGWTFVPTELWRQKAISAAMDEQREALDHKSQQKTAPSELFRLALSYAPKLLSDDLKPLRASPPWTVLYSGANGQAFNALQLCRTAAMWGWYQPEAQPLSTDNAGNHAESALDYLNKFAVESPYRLKWVDGGVSLINAEEKA